MSPLSATARATRSPASLIRARRPARRRCKTQPDALRDARERNQRDALFARGVQKLGSCSGRRVGFRNSVRPSDSADLQADRVNEPNAEGTDPTFYRSPAAAIAAPPEELAYVAAFDPAGRKRDAITAVDCDAGSASYGQVVGWAELPTTGNELHHFGWNACSSALCHQGHAHNGGLERRYLLVPGLRSSNTYVLDTKPDPREPKLAHTIEADELASKAGYSRPHTVHCGPGGIFLSALGGAKGADGPGGVALIDHDTFEVTGPWESDRGDQHFGYDIWWHLNEDVAVTSEWATPSMFENGLNPEDLLGRRFGITSTSGACPKASYAGESTWATRTRWCSSFGRHTIRARSGASSAWLSASRTYPRRCGCGTGRTATGR